MTVTLFGSSHGELVGSVLDGIPAGISVDPEFIRKWMLRRRPALTELTSQRKEEDLVEIVSGVREGMSEGGSITMLVRNRDVLSSHYDEIRYKPRPGHADLTLFYKYGEFRNYAGGGFLSGRMTAPIVAAGSVCLAILEKMGIRINAWIETMGTVESDKEPVDPESVYGFKTRMCDPVADEKAQIMIRDLISAGDSVGAKVKVKVESLPSGIGEPFFDSIESCISHGIFSIPAVKGIEFGSGFEMSQRRGTEVVDSIYFDGSIKTRENHNGGVLGGISNGMPLVFSVAIKPTSSIREPLDTVDLRTLKNEKLIVKGRHDPCIGIRAVPVIQCMTAFVLLDLMLQSGDPDLLREIGSGKKHAPGDKHKDEER